MEKKSDRINVLTESVEQNAKSNFIHAILNAIMKGYSNQTIFLDIIELVRLDQISDGVLKTAPSVLRSYAKEFSKTLNFLADKLEKISEFRDGTKIKEKSKKEKKPKEDVEDKGNIDDTDVEVVEDV
ncbi:MAG TPA: hypothetical protein VMZ91_06895 [Candidatus Paceibacterota bacterium]|nr:hypothetical protein [Candidatus Paceibacterota bacterium]